MPLPSIFCALVLTALAIVYRKKLKDILEDLSNRRGGPPNPMAPLPSTDARLLLRRPHKKSPAL